MTRRGLLLFPGQCAATTAAKHLLPLIGGTMVFAVDKSLDSVVFGHLIEHNGGLPCIPSRFMRISHLWYYPKLYRKRYLAENIFQRTKY
jgi:hypothetical protein